MALILTLLFLATLAFVVQGPVKSRPDPVACSTCGAPTWSASGRCLKCERRDPDAPPSPAPPPPEIDAEPIRREIQLDEVGRIDEDVVCRSCGYNLRGLEERATCPECSVPVIRSTQGDLLRFCDPAWVDRLARGTKWVLIGLLAGVGAGFVISFLFILVAIGSGGAGGGMSTAQAVILASTLGVATSAIVVWGVWLLTTPDAGAGETEHPLSARRLARWCVLAQFLASPLQLYGNTSGGMAIGNPFAAMSVIEGVIMAIGMALGLVYGVGYCAGLIHLGRLLRRVPKNSLARQTRTVMWGYIACSALGISVGALTWLILPKLVAGGPAGPGAAGGMVVIMLAGLAMGIASLVFLIWGIVLLVSSGSAFRRVAAESEQIWNAAG